MFITEAVTLTLLHLDIMPAAEQLLTLQARYYFLNLDRSVQIFNEGDRRCGTALGRSGEDSVWIRDRRHVGTVNFINCRQLLCGILQLIVGAAKVL